MTRLLRWLLALLVVGVFAGMAAANWGEAPVDFVLPDGSVVAARLPLLLLAAFLLGWLPPWLWLMTRRRLAPRPTARRAVAAAPPAAPGTAGLCDQAQPTIVPPAA